nr:putative ribonuclease H-like domain-containing protein [Tanacetum cinerariifolium]
KFQGKVDEGFLVGYSVCSSGPAWLFDIDSISQTMNYHPVIAENQSNPNAGFQDTKKAREEGTQIYKSVSPDILSSSNAAQTRKQGEKTENKDKGKSHVVTITGFRDLNSKFEECNNNSSNGVNAASFSISTAGQNSINSNNDFSAAGPSNAAMPNLEDLSNSNDADDVGAEADINNLESIISTKSMVRRDQDGISQMFNEDFHTCMFVCFLSQEEPKRVHKALKDPSWIEAMQEELLQFKMQKVWILVDLP